MMGEMNQPSDFGLKYMNQVFSVYSISYGQHAAQQSGKPCLQFAEAGK
jgi:hypothetical protein